MRTVLPQETVLKMISSQLHRVRKMLGGEGDEDAPTV